MALLKAEDFLTITVKVPKELHSKLDDVKAKAKAKGFTYDPTDAIVSAIEKDIKKATKDLSDSVVIAGTTNQA